MWLALYPNDSFYWIEVLHKNVSVCFCNRQQSWYFIHPHAMDMPCVWLLHKERTCMRPRCKGGQNHQCRIMKELIYSVQNSYIFIQYIIAIRQRLYTLIVIHDWFIVINSNERYSAILNTIIYRQKWLFAMLNVQCAMCNIRYLCCYMTPPFEWDMSKVTRKGDFLLSSLYFAQNNRQALHIYYGYLG